MISTGSTRLSERGARKNKKEMLEHVTYVVLFPFSYIFKKKLKYEFYLLFVFFFN